MSAPDVNSAKDRSGSERAEHGTESQDNPTIPADDRDRHFAPRRRWYDALFRYPSTLAW
jgi:hypothetical protein